MTQTIVIAEFGVIRKASDFHLPVDSFSEVFVSDKVFLQIKSFVFSYANDLLFTYAAQRGKEQLRVKNYVGLIPISESVQIEILPKTAAGSTKESRQILLKMLQRIPSYQVLSKAHVAASHLPLLEIYAVVFQDELEKLLRTGLGRKYEKTETNEAFIKGKVLIAKNMRQNLMKQHTFYVSYDDFVDDIPQNRILKTCLFRLKAMAFSSLTRQRIWQNLSVFEGINLSDNLHRDFIKSHVPNPHFERYQHLLQWAGVLLARQSFLPFSGNYNQLSLLFPMEVLFENYIGSLFYKYIPDTYRVKLQDRRKHLVMKHKENARFRLIPDIVIENEAGEAMIFDTKWKLIDASKNKHNYGIEQADLYQMYAYGKKYNARKLFLIYPANENFREPLEVFDYDEDLVLHVIPFNLMNVGSDEVRKLML
ncbi:McrC family protein [Emticicia sp. 21SJ11W-3]|uniref:McrC family protein n=1 Tax=Emticicia sp. 21SJ11W-3 TaxID=2916755 RepID=UPI00209E35A0|nr:McrC family protein [Emticicia sp. 21SJ11W-3]UTA69077.1 McrC family protein [Emticicia sp. 21SJ11W-3]